MKAQFVSENIVDFQRGEDPKKVMKLGEPEHKGKDGIDDYFEYMGREYVLALSNKGDFSLWVLVDANANDYGDSSWSLVAPNLVKGDEGEEKIIEISKKAIKDYADNLAESVVTDFKRGTDPKQAMDLGEFEIDERPAITMWNVETGPGLKIKYKGVSFYVDPYPSFTDGEYVFQLHLSENDKLVDNYIGEDPMNSIKYIKNAIRKFYDEGKHIVKRKKGGPYA